MGTSIWAALCAIDGEAVARGPAEIALSIAAGALSVVAGFVSFIPGGLVVRDAVMLELLAPAVGKGPALVCALIARLVWLLSEVGISIILYPVGKKPPDARPVPKSRAPNAKKAPARVYCPPCERPSIVGPA